LTQYQKKAFSWDYSFVERTACKMHSMIKIIPHAKIVTRIETSLAEHVLKNWLTGHA
jgi:hypothetical protein